MPVCWPGYSAQATEHPASCLPVCWPGYSAQANAHPATCLHSCLLAAQATLPRLLNTLPPACLSVCPGYSAKATAHPATCLPACLPARLLCPGYSAQATAHPATCLTSCQLAAKATLPRLVNTLPPACLWPGYSAQANAHPAILPACPFAGQATLPSKPCRLTACLPACWPGCSAQATLPRLLHTLPPACLRCPGYSAQATEHPASCLPVCWPGYSAQANAHPASCLPARLLARLLCLG